MRKTRSKRLISLLLAIIMVMSIMPYLVSAAKHETEGESSLKDISDSLNSKPYTEYLVQYADVERGKDTIVVKATEYDEDLTTAEVSVVSNYNGGSGDALMIGDDGRVTWSVNIPEDGMYAMKVHYISVTEKTNSIERVLYINGTVPFAEARYLLLKKSWVNEYTDGRFEVDGNGNELRPRAAVLHEWKTYTLIDSNGYYANPFEFYFKKGENTISFEAVRESMVVDEIILFPYVDNISYEEYIKGKTEAVADPIHLNAETPSKTSDFTVYPIYDRKSAITEPQDAAKIILNTIGSEKWETSGQWIEYEVDIEAEGLYEIVTRYRQNELAGLYTSRRIYIDEEIPFEEANYAKFNYDTKWHVESIGNGDQVFQFYFTPGRHTIRFEVTLGEMGPIVQQVSQIMKSINNDYLEILKLTGSDPDEYRDYGFGRVLPDVVEDLLAQALNLRSVISYVENMSNVKSQNSATLEQIARLLYSMGTDESQIAKSLGDLKSNVGTLGEWINTVKNQPLEFDWIDVQPASAPKKEAEAGFLSAFWYEIKQFVASFFTDYNSLGTSADKGTSQKDQKSVEVWVTTGRDQAQIMRTLIDNNFGPEYNISANLKLVAGGTLLPSVLAGVGPDIALPGTGVDPIQYAIRSAVTAINPEAYEDQADDDAATLADNAEKREIFSDFHEITSRFAESALIPMSLYGKTYGLPDTQTWPMMFYRTDILSDLGADVPKSWDDLLALIPVLQFNNMTIGMSSAYTMYMYQMGGELWADEGMRINLDSNLSLESFETMCNMFTQYSLPMQFDPANRFRTGEMPIFISEYTTYNNITIFATEIAGLWEFGPIPGTVREDGSINNVSIASTSAVVMMSGVRDIESSWKFMCWYTDKTFQVDYSNELVALLGPAGKNATANMEALEELPWTSREYSQLMKQMENTIAITPYPGSYILERYTRFALNAAYNAHADPVDSLLSYITPINKEITRKRTEFNLETLELGDTLAEKRMKQASAAIDALNDSLKQSADVQNAIAAIEAEDMIELRAAAAALDTSDSALAEIAKYMNDAANALESYIGK